ncbi:MAG: ROK family transcriptional regulator [Lachnospiraceae bacterium]|nr:ROK family transcriptional regulator [Lachnospiraceae bacterium]
MTKKVIASDEIKKRNRQSIYKYIRENTALSKQEISFGLHLSLPTVSQNIQYLTETGLIEKASSDIKTGGRNATSYACVPNHKVAIGIYLTANHINGVAVNLLGQIIGSKKLKISFAIDHDQYLKEIADVVESIKIASHISDEALLGVGIAVPGLISEEGEEVIYGYSLNFTGKTRAEITKYIPYHNLLLHDSFVAGYAEVWSNQDIENAFYISLNKSVGGCFIVNRQIYAGNSKKGGEIGHMTVVMENGKKCFCGQYGCFDTVANTSNLDKYTNGDLSDFFDLVKRKDLNAQNIWHEYLKKLSLAIHNIRLLFDCDIIIGGNVGEYMEEYQEDLFQLIDTKYPFAHFAKDYIHPCKYKTEATPTGAALRLIDKYVNRI